MREFYAGQPLVIARSLDARPNQHRRRYKDETRLGRRVSCLRLLSGLAVRSRSIASRAVLLHLKTVGIVPTVLLGDVVALLAHLAGEGDLGANVGRL